MIFTKPAASSRLKAGLQKDTEKLAHARSFVYDGLKSGKLKPVIDKIFAFDDIAEAHRYMESNTQVGKIVVTI